ncbi:malvidin galactosylase UGT88C3-like [Lolium perenne]|uniref:malvidin galactosylase UGT88C3-like n=1 Tax=Lolium perenne TaxID=4522 RepID=UPI0021EAE56C|nr:anthocyanidin 3-O-glucosyltransferase 2-like [Lolium perenne]
MANPTIVLLPVWGVGHFMPMIEAGKRMVQCSRRAPSLTVLLMPAPTAQAASDIAGQVRREEGGDIDIRFHHVPHVQLPTDHTGIEEFISRIVQLHVPHVGAAISGLTCPVAALVFDIFCTPALDVSRELAVPAYVYFTSSAAMLALLLRSPTLHGEVEVELQEMEGAVDVPGLPPVPPSFLPRTMLDRKIPTYTWFVETGRRYMEADGIIVNTAAELEPGVLAAMADGRCTRGVHAPTVYPIGPAISISPPAEPRHECVRWLDSQPPASVLFLCFGSKGWLSTSQVQEIAHGLERSGHRFLWVLRGLPGDTSYGDREPTDANVAEVLPEGFLEKTMEMGLVWPQRAPQKDILAHASVGGFVTHCGWNSILESLWFGVPMLPWPLDADQHFNAFALVHGMGVAVPLEVDRKRDNYVEAAELERAVRSLMGGDDERGNAKEKAMEMKLVCRNAVEQSGSSYASLLKLSEKLLGGTVLPKK